MFLNYKLTQCVELGVTSNIKKTKHRDLKWQRNQTQL